MNGKDLIRNLIDELIRARYFIEELIDADSGFSSMSELVNDIDVDIARYYDYEDSVLISVEDIEIE